MKAMERLKWGAFGFGITAAVHLILFLAALGFFSDDSPSRTSDKGAV